MRGWAIRTARDLAAVSSAVNAHHDPTPPSRAPGGPADSDNPQSDFSLTSDLLARLRVYPTVEAAGSTGRVRVGISLHERGGTRHVDERRWPGERPIPANDDAVGPRPALPAETAQIDDVLQRRHLVRPGITGLRQIQANHKASFEEYRRVLRLCADRRHPPRRRSLPPRPCPRQSTSVSDQSDISPARGLP